MHSEMIELQIPEPSRATKQYAAVGLKRARRSLDLIDWEELEDDR